MDWLQFEGITRFGRVEYALRRATTRHARVRAPPGQDENVPLFLCGGRGRLSHDRPVYSGCASRCRRGRNDGRCDDIVEERVVRVEEGLALRPDSLLIV